MEMYNEELKRQIKDVIEWSQDIPCCEIDELMENWQTNKRKFFNIFGEKLIYEVPETITFHLDEKARRNSIDEFIYIIDRYCNNTLFADFIDSNRETFFDNKVSNVWDSMKDKIPMGMKLAKAFKFFIDDEKLLDDIQTRYSRVVQEDKIEGTLCFSIHPLDYLSSSENTYNWRSCHALDGEYRAGNLSYMSDNSTVICYLRGADNVKLPSFPDHVLWNSKKWRMLLHFSEYNNMIFAGRSYPFDSEAGMNIVRQNINRLMPEKWYDRWEDFCRSSFITKDDREIYFREKNILVRGSMIPLADVVIDAANSCHFNDVLRSSFYSPKYLINENYLYMPKLIDERVHVGAAVKCVKCGEYEVCGEDTMMCDDCERIYGNNEDYRYCDICGDRYYYEDMYWTNNGDCICEHCYTHKAFTCERCGEVYYLDEMAAEADDDDYICKWCYQEICKDDEPDEEKLIQELDNSLEF